jgi:hypothetical protein
MDYYHGTSIKGLTELKPFASPYSNLKEPVVYLTTSKQLALHYIWDYNKHEIKLPSLNIRSDGTLVYQEMFSGALEFFYKGLSGYIYHCVGDYELNDESGVNTCAASNKPVPIMDYEFINDVYEKIMEYEKKGTFIYEKFENLKQYRHDIIRGIIYRMIKKDNLFGNEKHPNNKFFKNKFSKYWKEAEVLNNHGLL